MQETYSDKKLYKRLIVRSILAILVILFLIFVLPNCFRLLFPFILAFIVAAILSPLINKINSKIKKLKIKSSVSKKIITIILYLLILLAISGFVYFVSYTIIKQIISLLSSIQNNWGSIVAGLKSFEGKITGLIDKTPQQVSEFIQNVSNNFIVFLENSVKNLLSSTVLTTTAMISKTGVFFLNFLTFFLALYFIAIDYDLMKDSLKSVIGRRLLESFNVMKNSALTALGGYIRAQLILGLIAFIFM
ncbi:MAG TPA: hypothetical protein DDZ89_01725, partial [Clostridiales bacterium]|nr:hypothetical protein [Clostridiales bacterium]